MAVRRVASDRRREREPDTSGGKVGVAKQTHPDHRRSGMKNEYRFGYDEMLIQIQACVPDSQKGDG
ncbi:hypothetical protein, partial [Pseudomonas aeruginosa]|uniref:hypothetical protein n=1 Tax=Pseudomonas aeruginosa TaxID=287 RepID=UPI0027387325